MSEVEHKLDQLFCNAFSTYHPAMIDWMRVKFELKTLRAQLAEAQADNAALCAKLKLIEGIFIKYGKNIDYIINHSLGINKELWQAIKAACEVK